MLKSMNTTTDSVSSSNNLDEACGVHELSSQGKLCGSVKRKIVDDPCSENFKKVCDSSSKSIRTKGSESVSKQRLPVPPEVLGMFVDKSLDVNLPSQDSSMHQGRIRSFPHERGNWATHIFIEYNLDASCEDLFQQLLATVPKLVPMTDFHISVSKTLILQHHWIQPLMDSLKNKLQHITRFFFTFESLKFYTNEEKTRTFLGVQVSHGTQQLRDIVKIVDMCLLEFNLPTFYKNPSFHISIGWCLGDREQTLRGKLPHLQDTLESYHQNNDRCQTVAKVDQIKCKTGNKLFTFPLLC